MLNEILLPKLSTSELSYWYSIQFTRKAANIYFQANGSGQKMALTAVTGDLEEKHMFKFVGTWDNFKVVAYDGTELAYDGTNEASVAAGSGNSYKFVRYTTTNSWQIYNTTRGTSASYLNDYGAVVGHYNPDGGCQLNLNLLKEEYSGDWYQVKVIGEDTRVGLVWTAEYDAARSMSRLHGRTASPGNAAAQAWMLVSSGDKKMIKNRATGQFLDVQFFSDMTTSTKDMAILSDNPSTEWNLADATTADHYIITATNPKTATHTYLHQGNSSYNFAVILEISQWGTGNNSQFQFIALDELTANEAPVNFGAVAIGKTALKTVAASINKDIKNAEFTYEITGTDAALFTAELSDSWMENIGGNIDVTFAPTAVGSFSATLKMSYGEIELEVDLTATSFIASNDATLKSLTVSQGTLTPEFTPETTEYTVELREQTTIIIAAAANYNKASVTGAGTKTLVIGSNPYTITVTAEDGTTKDYTVLVSNLSNVGIDNPTNVIVVSSEKGILTVLFEGTKEVKVYTPTGILVDNVQATTSYVKTLNEGIYVLVIDGVSYKVLVK